MYKISFDFTSLSIKILILNTLQAASCSVEFISSIVCDITITSFMVYYFIRSRTGVQKLVSMLFTELLTYDDSSTDVMLQNLINTTVNMGLLGCCAQYHDAYD